MYVRGRSLGALDYRAPHSPLLVDMDVPLDEAIPLFVQRELLVLRRPLGVDAFFRIDTFARYRRPRKAIYSLGYVPVDATWGTGADERALSVPAGRIAIWVIGTVDRLVYVVDHTAPSSLSVTVSLLRECDRARMINLLRRTAPKSKVEDLPSTTALTASLEFPGRALVFRSIYDASVKYEESSFMKRLCVTDICPGDYVLVECMLVRKATEGQGT